MKISGEQLPNKANFRTFLPLNDSNFRSKSVNCLRVTKNVKEIKFEGVSAELESKNVFRDNNSQDI